MTWQLLPAGSRQNRQSGNTSSNTTTTTVTTSTTTKAIAAAAAAATTTTSTITIKRSPSVALTPKVGVGSGQHSGARPACRAGRSGPNHPTPMRREALSSGEASPGTGDRIAP